MNQYQEHNRQVLDVDYEIEHIDNNDAVGLATITLRGKGNFSNLNYKEVTFTITGDMTAFKLVGNRAGLYGIAIFNQTQFNQFVSDMGNGIYNGSYEGTAYS